MLTVLSLNLAHGRSDSFHQAFLPTAAINGNLGDVGDLLQRIGADVVAVQEADGPSVWSGRFDHVAHLATHAGYDWHVRGVHARFPGIVYGTGLLSRRDMTDTHSLAFRMTPPTIRKGLVVGTVDLHGLAVDVYSVHLDFARRGARMAQVRRIVELAQQRGRPVIIAGDLNADWSPGGATRTLAQALDLHTWRPTQEFPTFPSMGVRIDWVLVSRSLEIVEHRVLPDRVSDHRAVLVTVKLA